MEDREKFEPGRAESGADDVEGHKLATDETPDEDVEAHKLEDSQISSDVVRED